MGFAIVTFKLSDPDGVSAWDVQLDGEPQTMNGMQRQFEVTTGEEHTIFYTFSGRPGGTIKSRLIHKGKTIDERDPARIPPGAMQSFDRFIFTIAGDA